MKRMKVWIAAFLLFLSLGVSAQVQTPVNWSSELEMTSETEGQIVFTAKISDGWHMYSMDLPKDGPTPDEF